MLGWRFSTVYFVRCIDRVAPLRHTGGGSRLAKVGEATYWKTGFPFKGTWMDWKLFYTDWYL